MWTMDYLLPTGREGIQTGAHCTVRPANTLSYSEAWRPLRTSRYQWEEELPGTKTDLRPHYHSRGVKGQCFTREKSPIKLNQNDERNYRSDYDQTRNSGRPGRTEWRRSNLSSRSKSLDCRSDAKSSERPLTIRGDKGVEGSKVMSSIHAYNKTNGSDPFISKARGQSLPMRYLNASLGPNGGQSILQRIEKLYGSVEFGNTEDYKTTEQYKGAFSGTFPRRFSSGEQRRSTEQSGDSFSWTTSKGASTPALNKIRTSGRWHNQNNTSHVEGNSFQSSGLADLGTRSLDRTRSRSTIAAKIRAAQAAEEMDKSTQSNTFLQGITEVSTTADRGERLDFMDRKNWSRATVKEKNQGKMEDKYQQARTTKDNPGDDVFEFKTSERSKDKPVAAGVRNKINQFEALTQRAHSSSPRRAYSVPEHLSKTCSGVQRSSSAKALRTFKWGGMREEQELSHGVADIKSFGSKEETRQDPTAKSKLDTWSFYEDKTTFKRFPAKEVLLTKDSSKNFDEHSKNTTKLDLPMTKDTPPITNADETDFLIGLLKLNEDNASSGSGISTPSSSDNEETPTNTPGNSPLLSPITPPQKNPPSLSNTQSMDISPPLTSNLPDLVSKDNLNGKKRILDLNAWLDGLNPQIKVWEDDGEDDDDSTQRDEDSNYDSDSGESSVTVTSVVSNKSFSVSLADLCNFAGEVYDSENDSDEWQSTGRRSVSLSSDISGFSYVSVLPTEELDKLIQDVKSIGDNNLQDYEDVRVVVLHKDIGVGLGFSLAGGVDQNKPVTVHKVFHSGVAAQEASIKEGDQVLSINGSALSGCAHWEALRVLRRAKGREMGVVVLKKPDVRILSNEKASVPDLTPPQISETGQRITVSLEKSDRDLGFSLEGGVGSSLGNKPLSVQKIFQGGPFEKVLPGDEVLEVNGVSVVGMRRLEAWTLIRKLPPGPVSVVLRRNPHMT